MVYMIYKFKKKKSQYILAVVVTCAGKQPVIKSTGKPASPLLSMQKNMAVWESFRPKWLHLNKKKKSVKLSANHEKTPEKTQPSLWT